MAAAAADDLLQRRLGRDAVLAIGCVQAQTGHTDRCRTGVATPTGWLDADSVKFLDAGSTGTTRPERRWYQPGRRSPSPGHHPAIVTLMRGTAPRGGRARRSPSTTG